MTDKMKALYFGFYSCVPCEEFKQDILCSEFVMVDIYEGYWTAKTDTGHWGRAFR